MAQLAEIIALADIRGEHDQLGVLWDELGTHPKAAEKDSPFRPYPNKTVSKARHLCIIPSLTYCAWHLQMFLLHLLHNLPRQWVSQTLMQVFLWILRETGAVDVPSLAGFQKMETALRTASPIKTTQFISTKGNIFYSNEIAQLVTKVSYMFLG